MRSSRGFASTAPNFVALFRLAFASATPQNGLTWLVTVSRRIIMQKARDHPGVAPIGLSQLVSVGFQVHCPPLEGVLPTFRSRYSFAIGRQVVLSLAGWAPRVRTRFHVSRLTQVPARPLSPSPTGLSPAVARFPVGSAGYSASKRRPYNPPGASPRGLGWSAFARRYLRSRFCFPFLRVLRCFSSPGWQRTPMDSACVSSGTPASTLV